ncbi:PREDICTED: syntaxin-1A homolog [Nicrophorus vespilloides]|uniref:Syntaxin-1A homolog n=1 Tax=Nicrophorus vespilloides TaxID=110193 RepID=A0ABM1MZQ1_NICVS|nr:PREDICTED: syntaxin-1A homolog [Nicrophorus vespilloides]
MPTKDRLSELQEEALFVENEGKKKSKKKSSTENQRRSVFEEPEIVTQWINTIERNTDDCERILSSLANVTSAKEQEKLYSTFKDSEAISYNIATKLKKFREDLNSVEPEKRSTNYRMKYVQYNLINSRFKSVLEKHQNCVQKHHDIRKEILQKCNAIVSGKAFSEEDLNNDLDSVECQMFIQDYLKEEKEAREQLIDIEARHKELLTIESHLMEVKTLFMKMAVLVAEQQENINRIQYHAENANEYLGQTVKDLESARRRKKKHRKWTTVAIIAGIVIFLIILLIIFV